MSLGEDSFPCRVKPGDQLLLRPGEAKCPAIIMMSPPDHQTVELMRPGACRLKQECRHKNRTGRPVLASGRVLVSSYPPRIRSPGSP